ncbi:hypothetical protein OAN47_00835 [Planctomycetota bacterium]|nr:hypothetical protein [Planctomycetota bacterium]
MRVKMRMAILSKQVSLGPTGISWGSEQDLETKTCSTSADQSARHQEDAEKV